MKKTLSYLTAFLISVVHLIPFYILINLAFKTRQDTSSKWIPPDYLYLENFTNVWTQSNLGLALLNDLIITVCTVAVVIFVGVLSNSLEQCYLYIVGSNPYRSGVDRPCAVV